MSVSVYISSFEQEMEVVPRVDEALDWGPEDRDSSLDSVIGSVTMDNKVPEQTEDQSSAAPTRSQD